ncbi:MAG TPA: helix-turn-helix domain-containing protein [Bryobacteraceae bacterium]|nr:helix-turn-helix domain-containing protein [Bryobacteraceae bacterium]
MKSGGPSVPKAGARQHLENIPPAALRPGQPFNPYKLFTGIFIPEALVRNPQISSGAKIAYGRLVRYAGEDGDCHPSVKTLAREIGIRERQTQRYLAELAAHGFIRPVARLRAPRVRDTNGYIFLWHESFIGTNRRPAAPVSDVTPPPVSRLTPPMASFATSRKVSDVTPKESHLEESREEESQSSKDENDDEPA